MSFQSLERQKGGGGAGRQKKGLSPSCLLFPLENKSFCFILTQAQRVKQFLIKFTLSILVSDFNTKKSLMWAGCKYSYFLFITNKLSWMLISVKKELQWENTDGCPHSVGMPFRVLVLACFPISLTKTAYRILNFKKCPFFSPE